VDVTNPRQAKNYKHIIIFSFFLTGAHTKRPALETSPSQNVPSLNVPQLKMSHSSKCPTAQNVPLSKHPITKQCSAPHSLVNAQVCIGTMKPSTVRSTSNKDIKRDTSFVHHNMTPALVIALLPVSLTYSPSVALVYPIFPRE
jgi:hypothetical protein